MECCGSWLEELRSPSVREVEEDSFIKLALIKLANWGLEMWRAILNDKKLNEDMGRSKFKNYKLYEEMLFEIRSRVAFSPKVEDPLNRMSKQEVKELVSHKKDGCAPLFVATLKGKHKIVEYLVAKCGADIEQRGLYSDDEGSTKHKVTPLWCAAVTGKYVVMKTLIEHGANVNATSDSGSTVVRSACFKNSVRIVRYLVKHGADINSKNSFGVSCLSNAIHNQNLCYFLLKLGARVNEQDAEGKTALHYAVEDRSLGTTKLLLDHGADPHAKTCNNDDALKLACIKGTEPIFKYLCSVTNYEASRLADAYELLGTTLAGQFSNIQEALRCWRTAVQIRSENSNGGQRLSKTPRMPLQSAYNNATEFVNLNDIDELEFDIDAIRMQCLLISERVLGIRHPETISRIVNCGHAYVSAAMFQRGIDLWQRGLEILLCYYRPIYRWDICYVANTIVRLYVDLYQKRQVGRTEVRFDDVASVFYLLVSNMYIDKSSLLVMNPSTCCHIDRLMVNLKDMLYLLMKIRQTKEDHRKLEELVTLAINKDHVSSSRDTFLHLCFKEESNYGFFSREIPKRSLIREVVLLLLKCGAKVNARNHYGSTPLHLAAYAYNFDNAVIGYLLEHGAHLDLQNKNGECPLKMISHNVNNRVNLMKYLSLQCLAASAVIKYKLPYGGNIPLTLERFVKAHEKAPLQS